MSNKAKNSKESILCDAKELMKLYDRVTWHLPKARREHSAVRRFEDAGYAIIHYCTIAMELKGEMYLFSNSAKLAIARLLERIETGAKRWRNSIR